MSYKSNLFLNLYMFWKHVWIFLNGENGPGDWGSISGQALPKTQKMVLDISLLNTAL